MKPGEIYEVVSQRLIVGPNELRFYGPLVVIETGTLIEVQHSLNSVDGIGFRIGGLTLNIVSYIVEETTVKIGEL